MGKKWGACARGGAALVLYGVVRKAPVVWTASGAAFAFYLFAPRLWAALILGIALCGISLTFFAARGFLSRGGAPLARGLAGAGLAFSLGLAWGAAAALVETARAPPPELARFSIDAFSGVVAVDGRRTASGNTIMTIRLETVDVAAPGFRARLEWPRGRPAVLLVTDNPGEFPAGRRVEIGGPSVIDAGQALYYARADKVRPGAFVSPASRFRSRAVGAMSARIAAVSGKAFPLAQALLLGIKDDIDSEESTLFREAGCAHVLALSGQHLSIFCSLMSLLFAKLLKRADIAEIASVAIAVLFTWLAGAGPSLLRAAMMTVAGFIVRKLDRPQEGIAILSLVFCVALGWRPADARSLSFTLSYAAMMGLFLLSPRWESLFWRFPPLLAKPLAASFAALCATAIITLSTFGSFALGGIVASTLSGPIVLAFMWLILGATFLGSFMPFLDGIFAFLHERLHALLLAVMELGSLFPSISPEGEGGRLLVSAAIVALSLFVYSYPYVEYALGQASRCGRRGARYSPIALNPRTSPPGQP